MTSSHQPELHVMFAYSRLYRTYTKFKARLGARTFKKPQGDITVKYLQTQVT